jgi:hypothetical protein
MKQLTTNIFFFGFCGDKVGKTEVERTRRDTVVQQTLHLKPMM